MRNNIALSLCIPTNGVVEWVLPVIDSIYAEKNPLGEFEVIVTDNGNNAEFAYLMNGYVRKYNNFFYTKTDKIQFLNQIEAFKLAKGDLIKFINHRTMLMPNTLNKFIKYSIENRKEKPVVYFLNGANRLPSTINEYEKFDDFVKALSNLSSWSGGTAMWKSDFEKLDLNMRFNILFPHTDLIFAERKRGKYIINNQKLMKDIPTDATKKGKYDLFNAFAVEYVNIIKRLYDDGDISKDTYEYVKEKNGYFVAKLYFEYVIRKNPCSYDLSGYKEAVRIHYSDFKIKCQVLDVIIKKIFNRIRKE